ncbi:hypothetical protein JKG68_07565 [Microvirga aerilata]|uniref:Uncharacterized protein n=1 Tax=Microvirga aerilata TaxID=670292 RepID=A0A937CYU0_9HYPH|nr:hypothetical protein [Microvirga aerilata]MBL0403816.1 hypothetical protein [Microvirga aerilata]
MSRVDVASPEGRFFVMEVTHEVILDREHRIRPGFQDYVRYECQNDFPGRIEVISTAAEAVEREPTPDPILGELPEVPEHEVDQQPPLDLEDHMETEVEPASEAEADDQPSQVEVERQEPRRRGGLIGRLFGCQK